jgi:hypothetical protein
MDQNIFAKTYTHTHTQKHFIILSVSQADKADKAVSANAYGISWVYINIHDMTTLLFLLIDTC